MNATERKAKLKEFTNHPEKLAGLVFLSHITAVSLLLTLMKFLSSIWFIIRTMEG